MNEHNKEYETKVLDFNPEDIISKLRELGAEETPEYLARRYVFSNNDDIPEFIRLRDENDKVTLAYKKKDISSSTLGQTIEIQTEVADFDKTAEILKTLTFKTTIYIETKHHIFKLDGVEYSIDTWPLIEPILEIESDSIEHVQEGLSKVGLKGKDLGDLDIKFITEKYGFDVNDFSYYGFEKQEKFPISPAS